MRSSLRTALGGLLTTVVVLSVPVATLANPASAEPGQVTAAATERQPAAREFKPAAATKIFNKLQKALAPKDLPVRKLGDPLPRSDFSMLLRDAVAARGAMNARQQSIYDTAGFGRPVAESAGCTKPFLSQWEVLASAHFCVHYRPNRSAASGGATLSQAQTTLTTMEYVYAKEVSAYGFRAPVADSDGKFDVFLDQLGDQGLYGFCAPDSNSRVTTSWCGLDNDFAVSEFGIPPINALRVTAAHEFFHAIQYAYDAGDSTWFLEGTAAWVEDEVYPAINDYVQYLNASQLRNWRQSLDYLGSLHRYSSVIFWKFLAERYRNPAVIRQIWEAAAVSAGNRNGIQATAAVIGSKGSSLPVEFARYGVWNTLYAGSYADRSKFPTYRVSGCNKVRWCAWASGTLTKKGRDTGWLKVSLNHLSTAPLILRAHSKLPTRSKLLVSVNAPNRARGSQARVQVRFKSGKVKRYVIRLGAAGNGSKRVAFNPKYVRSAIVTLTNGSTGWNNQTFKVRAKVRY